MKAFAVAVLIFVSVACTTSVGKAQMRVEKFQFVKETPSLTDSERAEIFRVGRDRRRQLRESGAIDLSSAQSVLFEWPVRAAAHLNDPGYYGISAFVDHDPSYPDQLLDYNCGARTYDLDSGYNHMGTDIFNWPFLWNKMDSDDVEVVAAAAGEVIIRRDGYYDRNCGIGSDDWNGVVILHADGSIAIYVHMKSGSVTPKAVGESVVAGEYLGVVGSSGSSTGPHLHFEVWDRFDNLVDPWYGPCNYTNPTSWWIDQRPYYDSALNKISTHSAPVEWADCPDPDVIHSADSFRPETVFYYYAFGRDLLMGDQLDYYFRRPDDTVYESRSFTFDLDPHWPAFATADTLTIPSSEPEGMWKYEVVYKGVTYEHFFEISRWSAVAFSGVQAVAGRNGIDIVWEVHADEAIDGFDVYRRTGTSREALISGNPPLSPKARSFLDQTVLPGVAYEYVVVAVKPDGSRVRSRAVTAAVDPETTLLSRSFPNPFNPSTTIEYTLAEPSVVRLAVYDVRGELVAVLVEGAKPAGKHSAVWDGRDENGDRVGSGTYFYRLRVGKKVASGKMVLLK